ncbi:hypothetical protein T440DRAFT_539750 [Plenodomus tracheiphilus IPT5]|uniref:RBR-type E3 ubiquitin transferase n=1 Tax=Plenodomus tracheiphilus IPT5 TaxID=1408161 RepID=A0A6A7AXX8_9PLEO|nr:hypothetical protein T440DRAFT_539750 [Plenodomus tracheiphilus IPT5]
MAPKSKLNARPRRRVRNAGDSRADPIILEPSPEPEPQVPAAPEVATDVAAQTGRRQPTRAKAAAVPKAHAKEGKDKVSKKTAKPKKQLLPAETECSICADTKSTATAFKLITEADVCPHFKGICKLCISNMIKSKLNMTNAAFKEYEKAVSRFFISNDSAYMACLSSDCGEYFHTANCKGKGRGRNGKLMVECPYCDYKICLTCLRPWESHSSKSCAKMKEEDEKASAEVLKSLGVKPCPGCGVNIQKMGGCDHITCQHCQHHFCWVCLVPYTGNVQHTEDCIHGRRIDAAADPRNWADADLNVEQINQLIARNMEQLDDPDAQRAPLAQVRPGPPAQLPRPALNNMRAPPLANPNNQLIQRLENVQQEPGLARPQQNAADAAARVAINAIAHGRPQLQPPPREAPPAQGQNPANAGIVAVNAVAHGRPPIHLPPRQARPLQPPQRNLPPDIRPASRVDPPRLLFLGNSQEEPRRLGEGGGGGVMILHTWLQPFVNLGMGLRRLVRTPEPLPRGRALERGNDGNRGVEGVPGARR